MTAYLLTPSQTVGPFFEGCMLRDDMRCDDIVDPTGRGRRIHVSGTVVDGMGAGIPDAVLEMWQADSDGRYASNRGATPPGFTGFGRVSTGENGTFAFTSIKPGRVAFDDMTSQAPHISIAVFARGLLNHLYTRIYFEDEQATPTDPILLHVPEARRATLVARVVAVEAGLTRYRFDVVVQGANETAFFDFKSTVR